MNNKQASFGAKLTAAQAALTVILFLVGGFSVYTIMSLRGALDSTANREAAKGGLLAEMEARVAKLTAAQKSMMLSGLTSDGPGIAAAKQSMAVDLSAAAQSWTS